MPRRAIALAKRGYQYQGNSSSMLQTDPAMIFWCNETPPPIMQRHKQLREQRVVISNPTNDLNLPPVPLSEAAINSSLIYAARRTCDWKVARASSSRRLSSRKENKYSQSATQTCFLLRAVSFKPGVGMSRSSSRFLSSQEVISQSMIGSY